MDDRLLRDLAEMAGVATRWRAQTGETAEVSPETLRTVLSALGIAASSADDVRDALAALETGADRSVPGLLTAVVGRPVHLPRSAGRGQLAHVVPEDGPGYDVPIGEGQDGGVLLPAFERPGYYDVHLGSVPIVLAIAPAACPAIGELSGGRPVWGLAAQIYSLRSPGDGGIGHLGAVGRLGIAAAELGADALALSPTHAMFSADPAWFAPYSPSSRVAHNVLLADPGAVFTAGEIGRAVGAAGLGQVLVRLEAAPRLDWVEAAPARQAVARGLFDWLERLPADEPRRIDFVRFCREASDLLLRHAQFEALHAEAMRLPEPAPDWRRWPAAWQKSASRVDDANFGADAGPNAREVRFHLFGQWLCQTSLRNAQATCRAAGMRIGLIADMAVGMHPAGSHAWSRPGELLAGLGIGAPPDYYDPAGQNWGLTTFSPRALVRSGFKPFIETLRACLRHAGGVRIDHVMGLARLWLVPDGASATGGTYVDYPVETLLRLTALEAWRHRAIVIGEDLGTLPHGFRERLTARGVIGLRVARFERDETGFFAPEIYEPNAVATTTTHDMPTVAGWWAGADLPTTAGDVRQAEDARAWDRGLLWSAMQAAGVASGERPSPEETDPVVAAALAFIARTPSMLKIVPLEDALGVREQVNVPGASHDAGNWRLRHAADAADLLSDEQVRARLASLGRD